MCLRSIIAVASRSDPHQRTCLKTLAIDGGYELLARLQASADLSRFGFDFLGAPQKAPSKLAGRLPPGAALLVSMSWGSPKLIHEEHFYGLLVPLLRAKLERDSLPLFKAMNLALKARVETSRAVATR